MRVLPFLFFALTLGSIQAQTPTTIFPSNYASNGLYPAVTEGPRDSGATPFGQVGRHLFLYESRDLTLAAGQLINRIGYREDASRTVVDSGHSIQLEVWMGYSANTAGTINQTFDLNYNTPAGGPTLVFGQAIYSLPNLRDTTAPLSNGQFWLDLTTPFLFDPNQGNLVVEYRVYANSNGNATFNYRLDAANWHSPRAQGPASCGTMQIAFRPTRVGTSMYLDLSSAPSSTAAAVALHPAALLQAPSPTPLLPPGCNVQIDVASAALLGVFTNAGGNASLRVPIPNDPALFGNMDIAAQAVAIDTFAPGGFDVSNGAQIRLAEDLAASMLTRSGAPLAGPTGSRVRNYCPVTFFQ